MTTIQIRRAFNSDAQSIPYFFRNNFDPTLNLVVDTGKQALLSCEVLFTKQNLEFDAIEKTYNNIWNRLDLILEINHKYFNLYYDYLVEMLNFYLKLAEDGELYEICANIRELLELFFNYAK